MSWSSRPRMLDLSRASFISLFRLLARAQKTWYATILQNKKIYFSFEIQVMPQSEDSKEIWPQGNLSSVSLISVTTTREHFHGNKSRRFSWINYFLIYLSLEFNNSNDRRRSSSNWDQSGDSFQTKNWENVGIFQHPTLLEKYRLFPLFRLESVP